MRTLNLLLAVAPWKSQKLIPRFLYIYIQPPQICVVVEFNPIKYNMCSCTQHTHMTHELRVYHRHRHRVPVNLKTPTATAYTRRHSLIWLRQIPQQHIYPECVMLHCSPKLALNSLITYSHPTHPIQHTLAKLIPNTLWKGNWTITTACSIEL